VSTRIKRPNQKNLSDNDWDDFANANEILGVLIESRGLAHK
jgi:hypothetical protein